MDVEQVFAAEAIAERVRALGAEVRRETGDGEVFLLCILKGASFLLADLMRAISGPVGYGFIDVVRDVSDADTATALEIDFLSHTDIRGRNVYILKDVVSTGIIENYLLAQLRQHQPASLHLVALLDRPSLRTVELQADHSLFEVGDGGFVGYGLELEEAHANLPFIGRLRH